MQTSLSSPEGTRTGNAWEEKLFLFATVSCRKVQGEMRERRHKVNDIQWWHINAKIKRENVVVSGASQEVTQQHWPIATQGE